MTDKQIVAVVRDIAPKYDKHLHSKVKNPKYGVTWREEVRAGFEVLPEYISPKIAPESPKKDRHKIRRKLTVRITDEQNDLLQQHVLTACGYQNRTAWVWACIKRLGCEYAARQKNRPGKGGKEKYHHNDTTKQGESQYA